MATLLQKKGYQISVVTPKIYKGSPYFEKQNDIRIYRYPFFARNRLLIEYRKIPYVRMLIYFVTGSLLTLYAALRHRPLLIHTHWAVPTGLIGLVASSVLRKPHLVTIHGSDLRMALAGPYLLKTIFFYICKKAKYLTCVSKVQKKAIEQMGIKGEKISTFPMGVDEPFLEASRNRTFNSTDRPFTILSNRNLQPIYNVSLLVRAIPGVIREEPQTKFLIAGDGPERNNLEKEVRDFNIDASVRFLGRIPHHEMPRMLAESDIYVSTSLSDGTSVSLLESMASSAFPIVTDIAANREWIVDGENGFLVPTDDAVFLTKKIIQALRDPQRRREACLKNRQKVEQKAEWEGIIQKLNHLYKKASPPPSPSPLEGEGLDGGQDLIQ